VDKAEQGPGSSRGNIDWIGEVQSLLDSLGGDRKEYADYGGDVLLYAGFDLVARAVRLRVASVLAVKCSSGT